MFFKNKVNLNKFLTLIFAILVLGIFLRFANLEKKIYWFDETFTSLQLSGYSFEEVRQDIANGRIVGIEDLKKYQSPVLNPEKTVVDTVERIADFEPQLPPLYFIIARYWVQWIGYSVPKIRFLSALFSLLSFPLVYWLCIELFHKPLVGWMAIGLIAISPIHLLYAQEARPYSLWTATILFSCATLLWAMRQRTKLSWFVYGITISIGLYTFLLSALVYIANTVFVLIHERFQWTKLLYYHLTATALGFFSFLPWAYKFFRHLSSLQEKHFAATGSTSLFIYLFGISHNISLFFGDLGSLGIPVGRKIIYQVFFYFIIISALVLVGYSIYFLYKKGNENIFLFLSTLIFIPISILVIQDFLFGGIRALIVRYLLPSFLGVQLAVAFLLAQKISKDSTKRWKQIFWEIVILVMIYVGVLSCLRITLSNVWWIKDLDNINHEISHIINQHEQPLVISDTWFVNVLTLSYSLDTKVKYQLIKEGSISNVSSDFYDIFLYKPSEDLKSVLEQSYILKPVKEPLLWKLQKK